MYLPGWLYSVDAYSAVSNRSTHSSNSNQSSQSRNSNQSSRSSNSNRSTHSRNSNQSSYAANYGGDYMAPLANFEGMRIVNTGYSYSGFRNSGYSSTGSVRLRVTRPQAGDKNACAICAMTTISGKSYETVWNTAVDHGFHRDVGLNSDRIERTLTDLGVSFTRHSEAPSWDDLPPLALITVRIDDDLHAVVCERRDGVDRIYDSHNYGPVPSDGYTLVRSDGYFEIHD